MTSWRLLVSSSLSSTKWIGTGLFAAGLIAACSAGGGDGGESPFNQTSGGSSGSSSGASGGTLFSGGSSQGGSTSSGGSTSQGGTFTFGGSSSSGGSGPDACASTSFNGDPVPLDMYIMMDRSGSMNGGPWDAVKAALTSFLQNPEAAGIGAGIQFFPAKNLPSCPPFPPCPSGCLEIPGIFNTCEPCDPQAYLPPAVGIQDLPGAASLIVNEMNSTSPSGGTPTMPALQSAAQATTNHAAANPDRKVVIVLATDGVPTDCVTDISQIASVAAAALNSSPSVPTFVIGIGGELTSLDAIAAAGGTDKAFIVDASTMVEEEFLQAMNEIRGQALGCQYLVPEPAPGENPDPTKLNVVFTPEGGSQDTIPQVPNAGECKGLPGWYYDDPNNPTSLTLCPASCDTVQGAAGQIDIQLGCATVIAPPR